MHTRSVRLDAFKRADGAWDIEAELRDTKPFDCPLNTGVFQAGKPIHHMWLRVTIDQQYNVLDAVAVTEARPYPGECEGITSNYHRLIGLNLARGFRAGVRERLGGVQGCTHLSELAQLLPTAAMQAAAGDPERRRADRDPNAARRPFQLDQCHALRIDGPMVARFYPTWHRPARPEAVAGSTTSCVSNEE